ncbi:conserved hypothetical protein [Taylorella equigenitalis 14/56]|uniref:Uncharacterized protein n=1 Tax=Taylorella equigenitalis 14/56 TaxID=1091497 RepID=I7JPS4_9BURK|nr:DUF6707 family protein [Taylorella equigenitalis]WDU47374.1 hypothetical protein KNO30_04815 [Taylorella equigenitalis]CCG18195.1 conserved hypothetical protein [Taylorella equigenitalis 14/56]
MKQLNLELGKFEKDSDILKYIEQIPLKHRRTEKDYLESLVILSYILYVMQNGNFLTIVENLSKIEFFDDYDYWTWIEFASCLLAYHVRENGDFERFSNLKAKLDETLSKGKNELVVKVKKQVHKRFLAGETLDVTDINEAHKNKNYIREINLRLLYVMKLIKLQVYSDEISIDQNKIKFELQENLNIIRDYLDVNGFEKLYPFS